MDLLDNHNFFNYDRWSFIYYIGYLLLDHTGLDESPPRRKPRAYEFVYRTNHCSVGLSDSIGIPGTNRSRYASGSG